MLRICRIDSVAGEVTLRLEGRLVGPWVNELKTLYGSLSREARLISLDLAEVLFVDREGIALLRILRNSNVELRGCSPLVAEELKS